MRPAPLVSAVLFDLDGTLLDTAPDLIYALNSGLAEAGLPMCPDEDIKPCISGGFPKMLEYVLAQHPAHTAAFEALLERARTLYQVRLAEETRFFDGMERVLDALDARGLPWGIVTNKTRRYTEPLAEALHLTARAGCIISGDTTPEKKPHPLPLLEASRLLGLAPERCVFIGDAAKDMEAGRRAGMATLTALYGYIAADDTPHGWGADGFIEQPLDLLDWLDGGARP
jgi:2-phosphoglycolate phosphatase